jgi:hypothetical protein
MAAAFPEFANGDGLGSIAPARAADALNELKRIHNDVLAEVSVLQAASGGGR